MERKIRIEYAGAAYDVMPGGVLKELNGLQLFWGCHSRGLGLAPDSTGRLQGVLPGHIVPAQDEKLGAAPQASLPAIGRGSRVGASGALVRSEYREKDNL
jgi:hypothetical protein